MNDDTARHQLEPISKWRSGVFLLREKDVCKHVPSLYAPRGPAGTHLPGGEGTPRGGPGVRNGKFKTFFKTFVRPCLLDDQQST